MDCFQAGIHSRLRDNKNNYGAEKCQQPVLSRSAPGSNPGQSKNVSPPNARKIQDQGIKRQHPGVIVPSLLPGNLLGHLWEDTDLDDFGEYGDGAINTLVLTSIQIPGFYLSQHLHFHGSLAMVSALDVYLYPTTLLLHCLQIHLSVRGISIEAAVGVVELWRPFITDPC